MIGNQRLWGKSGAMNIVPNTSSGLLFDGIPPCCIWSRSAIRKLNIETVFASIKTMSLLVEGSNVWFDWHDRCRRLDIEKCISKPYSGTHFYRYKSACFYEGSKSLIVMVSYSLLKDPSVSIDHGTWLLYLFDFFLLRDYQVALQAVTFAFVWSVVKYIVYFSISSY